MKNKTYFVYIAAYVALLLPSPGRFIFGFILMAELFLLTLTGTLVNSLIRKLEMQEMHSIISVLFILTTTLVLRQVLVITYPETVLTLGYMLYLPAVSLFMIGYLYKDNGSSLKKRLEFNLRSVTFFTIAGLIYSLVRDILGFGTFTFFGAKHQLYQKVIISSDSAGVFSFLATLPGGFMLASICMFVTTYIADKFDKIKKAEA